MSELYDSELQAASGEYEIPTSNLPGRRIWLGWAAVFLGVLTLYLFTLAPGVVWQDQGDFQYAAAKRILEDPGDAVRVHPLYVLISHYAGRLTGISYARTANFVSALMAVITAANVYLIVVFLTGRRWAGMFTGFLISLTHTFWFLGVQAQTYSTSNAMMTAGMLCFLYYHVRRRGHWAFWMGLFFGLGFSTHMMSQIAFGGLVLYLLWSAVVRRDVCFGQLLIIAAGWCIGGIPQFYVLWNEYLRTESLFAAIASGLWGRWGDAVFNVSSLGHMLKRSMIFFGLNFLTPLVVLLPLGIWASFQNEGVLQRRSPFYGWFLLGLWTLYGLFAIRYDVNNMNNFFLPFYILCAMYITLGLMRLAERLGGWVVFVAVILLVLFPFTYPAAAKIVKEQGVNLGVGRKVPYRHEYRYYLVPWQQNQHGPRLLAEKTFAILPPAAVLYVDSTIETAFEYPQEIEGVREDVRLFGLHEHTLPEAAALSQTCQLYTVSNVEPYFPRWAKESWLIPVPLDAREVIYRIEIPEAYMEGNKPGD